MTTRVLISFIAQVPAVDLIDPLVPPPHTENPPTLVANVGITLSK